nr:MAG: ORF2 protein [Jingmen rodent astrovirus 2]
MANGQKAKQAKVTVTTVTSNGGGGRRSQRRRSRKSRGNATTTRTTTITTPHRRTRPSRRRNGGGRLRGRAPNTIHQAVTATLGTVGSNQGNAVETELVMLMNPALTKETTGSNQFGPIQMYAATYAQWRIRSVRLKATPVVGGSAVSGTIGRMSLNMTGNPTSASWSALGARPHADMVPGRTSILRLNARNFPGPKEGWYNTNTKGDPNMSIGGSIEVHTLGKTMSTYKNEPFTGGLWLLELTAVWEFRNYNPQPGLLNMLKGKEDNSTAGAQIVGEVGKPIEMKVPSTSRMGRAAGGSTNSEIIWQVADTTIKTITEAFPPPFNWLFQGGWWFIKRIADAPVRAGEETFRVYASIQDARADVPCIATQNVTVPLGDSSWTYQQVTPGNTGLSDSNQVALELAQPGDPTADFASVGHLRIPVRSGNDQQYRNITAAAIFTTPATRNGSSPNYYWTPAMGLGFSPEESKTPASSILTLDIFEADYAFIRDGQEFDPSMNGYGGIPVYSYDIAGNNSTAGYAYAYSETYGGDLQFCYVLFKCLNPGSFSLAPNIPSSPPAAGDVISWTLLRTPTVSNTDGGTPPTSTTHIWGGLRATRFAWKMAVNTQVSLLMDRWYVLAFASKAGVGKLTLGANQLTIKVLNSDPNTTLPNDAWIQPGALSHLSGILNSSGNSITWTPFVSTRVVPAQQQQMQMLDIIPEDEEPDDDDDSGYETDEYEALPDMTDSEEETPGRDELDVPTRPPTPKPGPGEHWQNPPRLVMEKMTPSGKKLYYEMLEKGVPELVSRRVAQEAHPHPCYEAWSAAYHDALADGCSPPTARSVAWDKATSALGSRGHAE